MKQKDVAALTGLSTRRILFYTEKGLLSGVLKKPGRGVGRVYTRRNLIEIDLIHRLSKRFTLEEIKRIFDQVPWGIVGVANGYYLVIQEHGGGFEVKVNQRIRVALAGDFGSAYILDMDMEDWSGNACKPTAAGPPQATNTAGPPPRIASEATGTGPPQAPAKPHGSKAHAKRL